MAIQFDATATGSGTTNYTFNHTCTGNDLYLIVVVAYGTAVTYNGVSMTSLGTQANNNASNSISVFGLSKPTTGTNVVSITTAAVGATSAFSASYSGVGGVDLTQGGNSSGSPYALSITTTKDKDWVVVGGIFEAATVAAGANLTQRQVENTTHFSILADSNGAKSPAGAYSFSISSTTGIRPAQFQVALYPSIPTGADFLYNLV